MNNRTAVVQLLHRGDTSDDAPHLHTGAYKCVAILHLTHDDYRLVPCCWYSTVADMVWGVAQNGGLAGPDGWDSGVRRYGPWRVVTMLLDPEARSTMIGDVINIDGKQTFIVDPSGHRKLSDFGKAIS